MSNEKNLPYAVVCGGVNIDIGAHSFAPLRGRDSNPGRVELSLGGVGRNIAHNMRLLGVPTYLLTAVGGGTLRDVLASRIPDIFLKHVYAVAAIAGGILMVLSLGFGERASMLLGFCLVIALRCLAARFRWNLPRIRG